MDYPMPKDNTGIPTWRCKEHGGHNPHQNSRPPGIDFTTQECEICHIKRTDHNANGCMSWCCCLCDDCRSIMEDRPAMTTQ